MMRIKFFKNIEKQTKNLEEGMIKELLQHFGDIGSIKQFWAVLEDIEEVVTLIEKGDSKSVIIEEVCSFLQSLKGSQNG